MMDINDNGSKRVLILVHPVTNANGPGRPAKSFHTDQEALDYALEGDTILYMFADLSVYPVIRGAYSGEEWGRSIAESFLYSGLSLSPSEVLDMCFHEDSEASKAFIHSLVDYVIDCHTDRGTD